MSTWVAAIVETRSRPDFWTVAANHGVVALSQDVPKHVLIDCDAGFDFAASVRLAQALSQEVGGMAIGFLAQTAVDVHELNVFEAGTSVRRLVYSRDDGDWQHVDGAPQAWERAYFFDDRGSTGADDSPWPDMLHDEMSDEDVARYEAARRAGDASSVMDLMHPSSTVPLQRVCAFLEVAPDRPSGRWKKPSVWSRLFGSK